jgi:hypothetical protein
MDRKDRIVTKAFSNLNYKIGVGGEGIFTINYLISDSTPNEKGSSSLLIY